MATLELRRFRPPEIVQEAFRLSRNPPATPSSAASDSSPSTATTFGVSSTWFIFSLMFVAPVTSVTSFCVVVPGGHHEHRRCPSPEQLTCRMAPCTVNAIPGGIHWGSGAAPGEVHGHLQLLPPERQPSRDLGLFLHGLRAPRTAG